MKLNRCSTAERIAEIDSLAELIKHDYSRKTMIDFDQLIYDLNQEDERYGFTIIRTDKIAIPAAAVRPIKEKKGFYDFYILIAASYSLKNEQFILAHELSHILLHYLKDGGKSPGIRCELEANYFAKKLTGHSHQYYDGVVSALRVLLMHPFRTYREISGLRSYVDKLVREHKEQGTRNIVSEKPSLEKLINELLD
jgi:hypothetical protein